MRSAISGLARSTTAPLRSYFNEHFEMVKDEVRRSAPTVHVDERAAWRRVAELENQLAEMSLYQARVLNVLTEDVRELSERISEMDQTLALVADVVAARTTA